MATPRHVNAKQMIEIDDVIKPKQEWCAQYGISPQLYDYRIKYSKLSPKEALTRGKSTVGRKGAANNA